MGCLAHSIIIPLRNRTARLKICLWSIARSAAHCGIDPLNYEIIVVDNGSKIVPELEGVRLIRDRSEMEVLNKPKLLNIGMEAATGDILTFLDADAIVGVDWMENIRQLPRGTPITRLCYQVRKLPETMIDPLSDKARRDDVIADCFRQWFSYRLAHEAYGKPETNRRQPGAVFGNSQFSIRHDVLGDLRCNEEYVGRGYEDLWFIREIAYRAHPNYKGVLVEEANRSMFHIDNINGGPDWWVPPFSERNGKRYKASRRPELETTWGCDMVPELPELANAD